MNIYEEMANKIAINSLNVAGNRTKVGERLQTLTICCIQAGKCTGEKSKQGFSLNQNRKLGKKYTDWYLNLYLNVSI